MAIVTFALMLNLLARGAAPTCVRVDIAVMGVPLPARLLSSAMAEAGAIWAAYGVDVKAVRSPADARAGAIRILVMFAARPGQDGLKQTLGTIRFVEGVPDPTIIMDTTAIDLLVSADPVMEHRRPDLWPALYDRVRGRVLGRALAHEIGHYLLRSRDHARTGLMRANHAASDLLAPERHGFGLSTGEWMRLSAFSSLPSR